jgi:hypothetical protein
MCQYTDGTYASLVKVVKGTYTNNWSGEIYIGKGYYAVCTTNDNNVYIRDINKEVLGELAYRFQEKGKFGGIQDFSKFSLTGWTKVSDNEIVSSENGYANKCQFENTTYEDEFIMKSEFTPITADANGYFQVCMAKADFGDGGTAVIVGKDANGAYISIGYINNGTYTEGLRTSLSSLRVNLNKKLSVVLEKKTDEKIWFTTSVTDECGQVVTTGNVDGYNQNFTFIAGLGHGKMTIYSIAGTWKAENPSFGYNKNSSDIKLAVIGHSFVEGLNSTISDLTKRWDAMLAEDVGIKNTCMIWKHWLIVLWIFNSATVLLMMNLDGKHEC